MVSIFLIAYLSQIGNDFQFEAAQERFVYESVKGDEGGKVYIDQFIPKIHAAAIRCLDSNDYDAREFAAAWLEENYKDPMVKRAIIWGSMPEVKISIRYRCETIACKYYHCSACGGSGLCPYCGGDGKEEVEKDYTNYCYRCMPYKRFVKGVVTKCVQCQGSGNGFALVQPFVEEDF